MINYINGLDIYGLLAYMHIYKVQVTLHTIYQKRAQKGKGS